MVVAFPNMKIEFLGVETEDEAMFHAREVIFHDIKKLPSPYKLVAVDEKAEIYSVSVI